MYRWLFDRSWTKRDAGSRRSLDPESGTFTVRQGARYRATVTLTWVESFAGNDMIASKLIQVGFSQVVVTGSGSIRNAEATWAGEDITAPLDSHLSNVEEIVVEPEPEPEPAPAPEVVPEPESETAATTTLPVVVQQDPADPPPPTNETKT